MNLFVNSLQTYVLSIYYRQSTAPGSRSWVVTKINVIPGFTQFNSNLIFIMIPLEIIY